MADSAVVISLFYELNVSAKIITSRISIQFSNISIFWSRGGKPIVDVRQEGGWTKL